MNEERRKQVLMLCNNGMSINAIFDTMEISISTLYEIVEKIIRKKTGSFKSKDDVIKEESCQMIKMYLFNSLSIMKNIQRKFFKK